MILLTVLVIVHAPIAPIAALAIVAAGGSAFFYPAMGAYMPSLVRDERELGPANSAWASLQNVSYIIGPAIGGILLAVGGVEMAFILNAASFLVIIAILWTLPSKVRPADEVAEAVAAAESAAVPIADAPATELPTTPAPPIADGPAVVAPPKLATVPLAGLGIIQFLAGFLGGGLQVLTTVLAIHVLNAGDAANGYLNADNRNRRPAWRNRLRRACSAEGPRRAARHRHDRPRGRDGGPRADPEPARRPHCNRGGVGRGPHR